MALLTQGAYVILAVCIAWHCHRTLLKLAQISDLECFKQNLKRNLKVRFGLLLAVGISLGLLRLELGLVLGLG